MQPPFFTPSDQQFLYLWSEDDADLYYDANDEAHVEAGKRIKNTLWNPTEYWAVEVCKRLGDFYSDGRKLWHQQAGRNLLRFRHYTWYRIFPESDNHEDVYFTVGVDANVGLLIKVDFQRDRPKYLNSAQYAYCEQNIVRKENTPYWTVISPDVWHEYDWNRLVTESVDFIRMNHALYQEHLNEVKKREVETRIARLCWNKLGWRQPSGRDGKSISKDSHEGKYGFGNEEWLFSDLYMHEGWCYSRFDPLYSEQNTYAGRRFNLKLYTYDGSTQQYFWVAEIRNAEVLQREQSVEMATVFADSIRVAVNHLMLLQDVQHDVLQTWPADDLFNVRFRPEQLIHFGDELRLFANGESVSSPRYVLLHESEWTFPRVEQEHLPEPLTPFGPGQLPGRTDPETRTRSYSSGVREYEALHDPLKNAFAQWLQTEHKDHLVTVENRSTFYGRADVIRQNGNKYHLYEVKTYGNAFIAIRVALGQLLTYSYASGNDNISSVESITIVCQSAPDDEGLAEKVISYLNRILNIPVTYIQFKVGAIAPECVLPKPAQ